MFGGKQAGETGGKNAIDGCKARYFVVASPGAVNNAGRTALPGQDGGYRAVPCRAAAWHPRIVRPRTPAERHGRAGRGRKFGDRRSRPSAGESPVPLRR